MKSPANRKIGCESLGIIIKNWEDNLIDQHIDGIKNALLKLLNDSQQETRQIARDSTTSFLQKRPELQSDFIDNLDSRMKKHIQQSPIKKRSFLPKRKGFRNPSAPKSFKKTFNNTEIRRSKSPLPMKSNKVDDKFNITLIHGREDEFLSTIENFIKNNRQSELSECIQKVVSGLGTLLVMNNESNVRRSMYIIKNLIETFPKDFEIILPQIFKVIFNNDSYDDLLKDIQSMYDPNTILYDLNHLRSTPKMIPYLAEIIQHADSDLRNGDLCESLIEMVLEFSNEEKAAATKIVQEMNKKNPDFIATVEDDFVKQAILDVPQEDDQTSFNQRDVSAWVEEIREYVSAVEEDQWNEERDILYTEIVESISQTNEKNVLFDLIIDILKSKNNDSYSQFLVVASENLRNRRVKGAKKLLQYMISTISNDEIISNVLSFLDSDQPQLNRNLLNEIAFIVNEGNAEQILPQLPSVVEVLLAFLNDEIVELRKSAVFCFVELILKFGEEMDEYFQHLTSVQQKLILFYRDMKSKE
ncbi:CLIP-associated protein-like [Histomonas meleagridis]|uniref:CLIP-associated protein-like n=1 Tax=Histomonas meleagridis TaxID=135588 RepID=UPI00355A4416|nr:CLIP-associated protein-like [Histomonas meleagridis]KAH0804883.1 CLIP-associated protein-like [Histomonas meleagridis]